MWTLVHIFYSPPRENWMLQPSPGQNWMHYEAIIHFISLTFIKVYLWNLPSKSRLACQPLYTQEIAGSSTISLQPTHLLYKQWCRTQPFSILTAPAAMSNLTSSTDFENPYTEKHHPRSTLTLLPFLVRFPAYLTFLCWIWTRLLLLVIFCPRLKRI